MNARLSIVITCLSDSDLPNTIRSIRDTAGDQPEIILVNDAGSPVAFPGVKGIRNERRSGVGPSRYIGCLHATGDYILICDSHMRFQPGWYEKLLAQLADRPQSLYCFECRGLDANNLDVEKPKSCYYGGTWNILGPDPYAANKTHIFETVWNKAKPEDDSEIPCVLGGAYAASRGWMLKCAASLRYLKQWGEDESHLSLRSWLLGGDCRIMTSIGIGHRFLLASAKEKQPYSVAVGNPSFNKLFTLHTLLPDALRDWLLAKWQMVQGGGELSQGKYILDQHSHIVEVERARNRVEFTRDFRWLADKFALKLPA